MQIYFYDSRQKSKLPFTPIKKGKARIYVCGPTVYDDAHLGHARSSIAFDLLRRVLLLNGYEVLFVKNITDIDDKIIKKAHAKNISIQSLADTYTKSYEKDMLALKVLPADISPKASENIPQISSLIKTLLDSSVAYTLENGDIYLSVEKDAKYGSISTRGSDEDENLARIQNDTHKKDERDFALWKSYKGADDEGYESPLGLGRPGWHIECSAMIESSLAYSLQESADFAIDIHGGGADLLFPHHENEASQTRCATGREIAKYWVHNGFVNINGEKMSKSLGNSFFIKDALNAYSGEVLRNYLLSVHYRAVLHFNEEDLLASKKRLDKIYRLKKRVNVATNIESKATKSSEAKSKNTQDLGDFATKSTLDLISKFMGDKHNDFAKNILEAMNDDLNISKALSVLEEMLNNANASLDKNPKDKNLKAQILANIDFVECLLGIGGGDEVEYFQQGVDEAQKAQIQSKIAKRAQAKKDKDFDLADALRDELAGEGIIVLDTPQGSVWEKIE